MYSLGVCPQFLVITDSHVLLLGVSLCAGCSPLLICGSDSIHEISEIKCAGLKCTHAAWPEAQLQSAKTRIPSFYLRKLYPLAFFMVETWTSTAYVNVIIVCNCISQSGVELSARSSLLFGV